MKSRLDKIQDILREIGNYDFSVQETPKLGLLKINDYITIEDVPGMPMVVTIDTRKSFGNIDILIKYVVTQDILKTVVEPALLKFKEK